MAVYLAKLFRFPRAFFIFFRIRESLFLSLSLSLSLSFSPFFPTLVGGYWNSSKFNWSYRCTNSRYTFRYLFVFPRLSSFLIGRGQFFFLSRPSFLKIIQILFSYRNHNRGTWNNFRGIFPTVKNNRWNLQICHRPWRWRSLRSFDEAIRRSSNFQYVNNLVEVDSRVWDNLKVPNLSHVSIEAYTRERSQLVTRKSI